MNHRFRHCGTSPKTIASDKHPFCRHFRRCHATASVVFVFTNAVLVKSRRAVEILIASGALIPIPAKCPFHGSPFIVGIKNPADQRAGDPHGRTCGPVVRSQPCGQLRGNCVSSDRFAQLTKCPAKQLFDGDFAPRSAVVFDDDNRPCSHDANRANCQCAVFHATDFYPLRCACPIVFNYRLTHH